MYLVCSLASEIYYQRIVLYCFRSLNKLTKRNLQSHSVQIEQCVGNMRVVSLSLSDFIAIQPSIVVFARF